MKKAVAKLKKDGTPGPADPVQRFERRIAHDYFVRIHMSLILLAVTASGVLTSKALLVLGVHSLRLRYPLAVLGSYLVFLGLVRVWIWYVALHTGVTAGLASVDTGRSRTGGGGGGSVSFGSGGGSSGGGGGGDDDIGFSGFRGGSSGGGGASSSWDAGASQAMVSEGAPASSGSSGSSGWFSKFDLDLGDDDSVVVIVLLGALVVGILGGGIYLVYAAPHILPEAAWQAVLATTLTRVSKQEHHDWMRGVLRSTWIPFAIVLILAGGVGWAAHRHCPSATRLVEVFHCAVE